MKNFLILSVLILAPVLSASCRTHPLHGSEVRYADSTQALSSRWQWAKDESSRRGFTGGYWVGYAIKKMMGEHSCIGSYYSDESKNRPTLLEVISGYRVDNLSSHEFQGMNGNFHGIVSSEGSRRDHEVMKEIGILFHCSHTAADIIDEMTISNLSLHVDLHDQPLLWLGNAGDDESIEFLQSIYARSPSAEVKKEIITAIGIHSPGDKAFEFLKSVLLGSDDRSVRAESAFWLGESGQPGAGELLEYSAAHDPDEDVCDQCVFSISRLKEPGAVDRLIHLAEKENRGEIRKKAIFWIGQIASARSAAALKNLAINGDDLAVEKAALYSLSQLSDSDGIETLISVARTHPNLEMRKEAIFLLSDSENPRALEALVAIIRN